jgi:hypothetical protein
VSGSSLNLNWRPQGDSNPRYRRESRKILKHQTVDVVRVSRFSLRFKRIASYIICDSYDDFVYPANFYHIFITLSTPSETIFFSTSTKDSFSN